jgi:hypothetical protein
MVHPSALTAINNDFAHIVDYSVYIDGSHRLIHKPLFS